MKNYILIALLSASIPTLANFAKDDITNLTNPQWSKTEEETYKNLWGATTRIFERAMSLDEFHKNPLLTTMQRGYNIADTLQFSQKYPENFTGSQFTFDTEKNFFEYAHLWNCLSDKQKKAAKAVSYAIRPHYCNGAGDSPHGLFDATHDTATALNQTGHAANELTVLYSMKKMAYKLKKRECADNPGVNHYDSKIGRQFTTHTCVYAHALHTFLDDAHSQLLENQRPKLADNLPPQGQAPKSNLLP